MHIRPPQIDRNHPDYPAECEAALDYALRDLIDEAAQVGWMAQVSFGAIEGLIAKQRLAYGLGPSSSVPPSVGQDEHCDSFPDQGPYAKPTAARR